MAQTAVDVVVRVKDLAALDRLKKSLAGVDGATLKASQGINKFENSIKRLQSVLGGLAVGDQLRRAFGAAADFSATTQRLENLTKQYTQLAGIQELAAASAQKFGISTAQASADLADLGSRLGSSGANLKDLNDIYEGFNTLLAVNAVNSQQAASAQLQLNQALGSGRLAGEEFNAINEATPQLLDEVAKVLGVARGELKQLASDGEISSQVLIEALRNVAEDGGDALADFFKTPAGQLKLFDKAIQDFQVTVGQQLLPVFTPIVESLSTLLQLFGQLPGPVKATAVAVTALGAAFAILGGPITAIVAGIIGITLAIKKLADENEAFAAALQGAWNNILAGLEGVGAFFQAFFSNISQQGAEFIAYWSGLGNQLAETWNQGIANITEAFGRWQGYFNEVVTAVANAWNQLMSLIPDAFFKAVSALGEIFSPFVDFLNRAFGSISNAWNSLLQSMGENWGRLLTEMIGNFLPFVKVFRAFGIDIGEGLASGVKAGFQAFSSFQPSEAPSLDLPGVSGLTGVTPPSGGGGGKGGKKGRSGKSDAERELERQLELQQKLKQNANELLAKAQERLRVIQGITDFEKIQAEGASAVNDVKRQYADLLKEAQEITDAVVRSEIEQTLKAAEVVEIRNEELQVQKQIKELQENATASIDEEIAQLQAIVAGREEEYKRLKEIKELEDRMRNAGLDPSGAAAKVDQRDALKKQAEEVKELNDLYSDIASGIAGEFTSAFKSIIDGSKEVNDAFADMLQGIADQFLNMAMKILQDALTQQLLNLFKNLFAGPSPTDITGGAFNIGRSFEGGGYTGDEPRTGGVDGKGGFPAILHPQETVVDHYGDAANAMVSGGTSKAFADNDDALEAASAAFAQSASAMTQATEYRMSSITAQQEQQAMAQLQSSNDTINVRFDTMRIGELDVVTKEEAMAIGTQSAKKARADVFKDLRNMPAVRGRSGVK